jgi:penicillin amidase
LKTLLGSSILLRLFLFVLCPAVLFAVYIYQTRLSSALPQLNGVETVLNISNSISIKRDQYGVPYIRAKSPSDVYFAMGYVHAQDRLWQLEVQRRISNGTLSEIFGKASLHHDIWIKTLRIYEAAEAALVHLSPEAVESLEAYSNGINQWLVNHENLPIEFQIHNIEATPWTPIDSIAWVKMFALNLSGDFQSELTKMIAAKYLSTEQQHIFFPEMKSKTYEASQGEIDTLEYLLGRTKELENRFKIGGLHVGSNAWVVSGEHTESGLPLLANDPHLGLQIPSIWYPANQHGGELNAKGMSLVGLPVIIFGQNEHIAWGGTSMGADVQDLFYLPMDPEYPKEFLYEGAWQNFNEQNHEIKVKQDFPSKLREPFAPLEIQTRHTKFGPVISDAVAGTENAMILRWTALDDKDTTYEAFFKLNYAENWEQFRQATSYHIAPALNLLYADIDNNIGLQGVGRVPIRKQGHGDTPVIVQHAPDSWQGYIPFDEMPYQYNPASGFIINANDANVDNSYPYFISNNFALPYRANRIRELLNTKIVAGVPLTAEAMQAIQADVKDLSVNSLQTEMLHLESSNHYIDSEIKQLKQALSYVKNWNGVADKESVGATIYYIWLKTIRKEMFQDELAGHWNARDENNLLRSFKNKPSSDAIAQLIKTKDGICDNVKTRYTETCDDILFTSLRDSVGQLDQLFGKDISDWQWGSAQTTVYAHQPFSQQKILRSIFERRVPSGGSPHTVDVAGSQFDEFKGYQKNFGAGFRFIIELQNSTANFHYLNSTGQSGHLISPLYDDTIEKFAEVKHRRFLQQTELENLSELHLNPIKQASK